METYAKRIKYLDSTSKKDTFKPNLFFHFTYPLSKYFSGLGLVPLLVIIEAKLSLDWLLLSFDYDTQNM